MSVITEIRWNMLHLASFFQGHPRSSRTNTDRSATYDFLLVIHSNRRFISYISEKKCYFSRKLQILPAHVFNIPVEGVPIGIL